MPGGNVIVPCRPAGASRGAWWLSRGRGRGRSRWRDSRARGGGIGEGVGAIAVTIHKPQNTKDTFLVRIANDNKTAWITCSLPDVRRRKTSARGRNKMIKVGARFRRLRRGVAFR